LWVAAWVFITHIIAFHVLGGFFYAAMAAVEIMPENNMFKFFYSDL
jgi:hypothetical protein